MSKARGPQSRSREGVAASPHAGAVVGPNAILQLLNAVRLQCGAEAEARVLSAAGLQHYAACRPTALVPEEEAERLFTATRSVLPEQEADALLATAGQFTGDYIVANRVPRMAKRMLRLLPAGVALRMLLLAIKAHAWTFAGSGHVKIGLGWNPEMTIAGNPLATPGCPWHVGVLQQLFRQLVTPSAWVAYSRSDVTDHFRVAVRSRAATSSQNSARLNDAQQGGR